VGLDSDCCLTGKSTGNQKVERLHRDSTEKVLEPYIILFQAFVRRGFNQDNNLHMYALHYLFLQRLNDSLRQFEDVWNNHNCRSFIKNRSPKQCLVLAEIEGKGCGVKIHDDELDIFSDVHNYEDVVNAENQVVCDSRYNPFNDDQFLQFTQQVPRLTLHDRIDETCHDLLFQTFITTLDIAMQTLQ